MNSQISNYHHIYNSNTFLRVHKKRDRKIRVLHDKYLALKEKSFLSENFILLLNINHFQVQYTYSNVFLSLLPTLKHDCFNHSK